MLRASYCFAFAHRVNLSSGKLTEVGAPVTMVKSKKCEYSPGADVGLQVIKGKPYGLISEYRKVYKRS